MRPLSAPLLALALLTTTLAVLPAADAEKMCLTAGDTAYFYLKYLVGTSYSYAYSQLSKLGCPGIESVLCYYYAYNCPMYPSHVDASLLGQITVHAEVTVGGDGGSVDAGEDVLVPTLSAYGVAPGVVVDGVLYESGVGPLLTPGQSGLPLLP